VGRSLSTLINVMEVNLELDEVLYHLETTSLDSIIDGGLAVQVNDVRISTKIYELACNSNISFTDTVVNWRLSVDIKVVHLTSVLK